MNFARSEWLWWLMVLPPLALWVGRGRRRRFRDWRALAREGRPPGDGAWGWFAAIGLLIVAAAGPRWGSVLGPATTEGRDLVFLVDVSRSMGAEDALPDRLSAAVRSAEGLVDAIGKSGGDRAAVVAFAGRGVVRCPLTENLGAVVESLGRLRPGDVQPGGTDLGAGLDAALDAFDDLDQDGGRTIVLFTDGEDHADSWRDHIPRLNRRGIVVQAVAVGDPHEGHPVPSGSRPGGGVVTYQGEEVLSMRRDDPLRAISGATGGTLVPLTVKALDLKPFYASRIEPAARRRRDALRSSERVERPTLFVLGALAVGMAGSWPRPRGYRAAALLAIAALTLAAGAGGPSEEAKAIERGNAAFAAGDFTSAVAEFERAVAADPNDALPRYDLAAALFRLGRFPEAGQRYQEARRPADPVLKAKIDYALGNVALALGDVPEAIRRYDDCLASPASASSTAASLRRDAIANRTFAAEHLPPSDDADDPEGRSAARRDKPKDSSGSPREPGDRNGQDAASGSADPGGAAPPKGPASKSARGAGGAGGSVEAPPRSGTAEDQLEDLLDNIRDARNKRLPDDPLPTPSGDHKDW